MNVPKARIQSVDALRGLVMIIMALDHTRDFFHSAAPQFQPDDLTRTWAVLFFTRWITHFCAPVFMFTAGLGAFLGNRSSGFLWRRGLWLVILELTVLRLGYSFNFAGPPLLTILWALGWSMVALAVLMLLPRRVLVAVCVAGIGLHNLADGAQVKGWFWSVLHRQGLIQVAGVTAVVSYPLIPWIFVMAAGYCFGPVLRMEAVRRRRVLAVSGVVMSVAFVVIRAINLYGDPRRWGPPHLVLSFLRVTKYPPSLDFVLMTLGPALIWLAWADGREFGKRNPLMVFGRVPLFYFLGHFYLLHVLAMVCAQVYYGHSWDLMNILSPPRGYGYSLGAVYVAWAAVVVVMYPLCVWFAGVKERRREWWWLSYL